MYLFSVPELNAGCFFVPMPSAKEFQRLGRGGDRRGGGAGMPIKLSVSPRGMCANVFPIASLSVLPSAALALNWI